MPRGYILLCLFLGCMCVQRTYSQTMPLKGVVWDAPEPPTAQDFLKIHEAGVEAIRLPVITDRNLLHVADTLGLQLFQDLPIRFLPAPALLDTLEYAKNQLSLARQTYHLYRSAHHFGVSTKSDTSSPQACEYFEELAAWAPELTLYYTSAFIADDQCSSDVDLVLLDVRKEPDPVTVIKNWSRPTPVGFSSVGQKVDPDKFGLYQVHSPQSQARFLENHLPRLLETTAEVIFVYRWQDAGNTASQWGLIDASGQERPAFDVLRGIYTDAQHIFAFDFGDRPRQAVPWPLILSWTTCLLIALLGLWYDRFLILVYKYAADPWANRDALYRKSVLPPDISLIYVVTQGILLSAVVLILVEAFGDLLLVEAIAALMSPYILDQVSNLTSNFYLLVLVVIALYLIANLISYSLAALIARRLHGIAVEDFFTINAMNHTPLGAMLPMVMIAPGLNRSQYDILAIILAFSWAFLSIFCIIRGARSFATLTRRGLVNSGTFGVIALPLLVLAGLILVLCLPYTREYIIFWWNLIFRA
ncbi:MAG: hypothetical protein F4065_10920 [Rhodothermaceae bacterium]|nr:hypothetical protein [Rhodothermaceae bacterium]MYH13424.1 hypothetical protein [Rhodothermaceae bacterium]MYJ50904.1 hypothetical protein [Rhodothermaceae bacterium]